MRYWFGYLHAGTQTQGKHKDRTTLTYADKRELYKGFILSESHLKTLKSQRKSVSVGWDANADPVPVFSVVSGPLIAISLTFNATTGGCWTCRNRASPFQSLEVLLYLSPLRLDLWSPPFAPPQLLILFQADHIQVPSPLKGSTWPNRAPETLEYRGHLFSDVLL